MCKKQEIDLQPLQDYISTVEEKNASSLIQVLHHAQNLYGYLPREVQTFVAEKLNVAVAKVYGVVSFYSYFTETPRGKYVARVCMGTACYVKGAGNILDVLSEETKVGVGETAEDLSFSLEATRCIGACGLAPVFTVNEDVYGNTNIEEAREIIKKYVD